MVHMAWNCIWNLILDNDIKYSDVEFSFSHVYIKYSYKVNMNFN